ncbi:hypothetical protein [Microbacterium profundi]|uniref:Nucleotidyl transferase n=1 Tax=Microbacterium profundi TaxID=450380 RepID=A0ABV3LEX9_9MICO|nr:hypothetical protein [Microbacterium profundi]
MADALDRDDIITGLRELVGELHAAGEVAGIRLVGGAALAIRYFDRRTTGDLGSLHVQPGSDDAVLAAASRVGERRGWSAGWFNFAVEQDALLAMKLRANRPGRDVNDMRQLLALCGVTTLEDAEAHYDDFYPGDGLTDRAIGMVQRILEGGLPTEVPSPGPIDL